MLSEAISLAEYSRITHLTNKLGRQFYVTGFLALSLVTFPGCISVPHSQGERRPLPVLGVADIKPSVSFETSVQNHSMTSGEAWAWDQPSVSELVREQLEKSDLFSRVREGDDNADLKLRVTVDMHPSPNSHEVSMLAGLTLLAIPMWTTDSMTVSVIVSGERVRTSSYQIRRKETEVAWLPLIVAAPFMTIWSSKRKMLNDGMHSILTSMYEDGQFKAEKESREVATFLGPGGAEIRAVAPGSLSSDVDNPTYRRPENADNFAIVIGVEKHSRDLPEAQFAERDAKSVREHLRALGYPERNIAFLTGLDATRSGIAKYVETWLPRNVKPNSDVTVFFSGHGAPDPVTGKAYLVPFDGDPDYLEDSTYSIERLQSQLSALKVKRVILLLDACFSGSGTRSLLAKGTRPLVAQIDRLMAPGQAMAIMAASEAHQTSGVIAAQGHGLFTYFLLRGLNGAAKDSDGRITLGSLFEYVAPNIQDLARRTNREQSPQFLPGKESQQARWAVR